MKHLSKKLLAPLVLLTVPLTIIYLLYRAFGQIGPLALVAGLILWTISYGFIDLFWPDYFKREDKLPSFYINLNKQTPVKPKLSKFQAALKGEDQDD